MAERLRGHSKQVVRAPSRPSCPDSQHILLTHSQQMLALQSSCPHSPHSPNNPKLAKPQYLTRPLRPRQAPVIKYTLLGCNDHMSTFVCTTCHSPLFLCVVDSALDFMLPKAMPNFTFELAFSIQLIHCFI